MATDMIVGTNISLTFLDRLGDKLAVFKAIETLLCIKDQDNDLPILVSDGWG